MESKRVTYKLGSGEPGGRIGVNTNAMFARAVRRERKSSFHCIHLHIIHIHTIN